MNTSEIYDKVMDIIKKFVKDETKLQTTTVDTSIIDDLKVNSARLVDIIIEAEDVFNIEIDDDDADRIKTVGDAVNIVEKKLSPA